MIDSEELKKLQDDAKKTILCAMQCAENGHNHITQSHSISSIKLLEMTSELLNFRARYDKFGGIKS